jgi:hypothetical protein
MKRLELRDERQKCRRSIEHFETEIEALKTEKVLYYINSQLLIITVKLFYLLHNFH